ncbi:MAG TPA: substrate-binding domain-containing protein, partial [Clostridiales bacterium]|nr:substrate-binding domain-containing protein [Clostridiales bacterium]
QSNTEVVKTIYIDSNERSATKGAEALLTEHPEINVLVGLNEWSTLGVGRAIQNLGLKDRVCGVGFDSNVDCVSMLENGDLDTLIVQNPFSIGYTAIENAAKLLEGEKVKEDIEIATYRVDRSNMFSPDIQKILVNFD